MMHRCRIEIANAAMKVEIILEETDSFALQNGLTLWGKYSTKPKDAGNVPPERKGWLYALTARELRLIDMGGPGVGMVGGGLGFGELAPLAPFATLSDALMTSRGIEPMIPHAPGKGWLDIGAALDSSLTRGPVTWRLSGYRQSSSNIWVDPDPKP